MVLHPTPHLTLQGSRDEKLPVLTPLADYEVEGNVLLPSGALAPRLSAEALAN